MPGRRAGVYGFDDIKFWLALLFYGASLPLFFEGGMSWESFHVVMPFFISFIVVGTLAWDYRVVGNPNHPFCLVLHAAFLVSMVFLLNRLMLVSDFAPLVEGPAGTDSLISSLVRRTPLIGDVFRIFDFALKWLGFAIMLFFVSGAIMFPPRIASALLVLLGLGAVAISVGQNLSPALWSLFAGVLLMIAAFWLQLEDEGRNRFWNRVGEVLRRSGDRPAMDVKIKIAMLRELEHAGSMSEKQVRGVVANALSCRTDDPRINPVCARIADQMANQDGLAESRDGNNGWRFVLAVPDEPPDLFAVCARVVRVAVTLGFCVLYILSPIDLIPDATPVFGVVDDMLLGTVGLLSSVRTVYGSTRPTDRHGNRLPFYTARDSKL